MCWNPIYFTIVVNDYFFTLLRDWTSAQGNMHEESTQKPVLHSQFKCYIVWHYFVKFSQAFLILFIKFCTEKFFYKNMSEIFFPQCLPQHFKHQKKLIIKGIQRKTKWFFVFICTTFSLRSTKKNKLKVHHSNCHFGSFDDERKESTEKFLSFYLSFVSEWCSRRSFFLRILWLISRLFIHRFLYVMRGAKIKEESKKWDNIQKSEKFWNFKFIIFECQNDGSSVKNELDSAKVEIDYQKIF